MHASLRPIVEKFERGEPVTVIAFGDSITWGSQVDPARDESLVYHKQWRDRLAQRYPKLELTIVNRGVPGHKIGDAHERVDREVIEQDADAVIVAFGINDCWDGPEKAQAFEDELGRLVERIRAGCSAAIILMTTNMLNYRSSDEAMNLAWFAQNTAQAQNAGWTDDYMQRVRNVASRLAVALADGYAKWQAARQSGVDTDALLANLANHPNRQGHALLADALDEVFTA
jgi:lysophospholipase L1-like esterase